MAGTARGQSIKPPRWNVSLGRVGPNFRSLWRGLVVALPMWDAGGGPWDYAARARATANGGATWEPEPKGIAGKLDGSDDYFEFTENPGNSAPSGEITVYTRWKHNGVAGSYGALISKLHDGSPNFFSYSIHRLATQGNVRAGISTTSGGNKVTSTIAHATDRFLNYFLRWRSGENIYFTALEDDGSQFDEKTAASLGGTIIYNGDTLRIGQNEGTANYGGLCSIVLVWNRRLTNSEIATVARDPFGMFRPWRPIRTAAGAQLIKLVSETVELPESLVRTRATVRAIDEALEISEAISRRMAMVRAVDESVEVSEVASAVRGLVRLVGETLELSEGIVTQLGTQIVKLVNESVEVAEAVLALLGGAPRGAGPHIEHGTSFPGSPTEHDLFFRDDEQKLYIRNGGNTAWLLLGPEV